MKIRQALISLSDKNGALEFAQGLVAHDVKLLIDRRHRQAAPRRRPAVTEVGLHRLSRKCSTAASRPCIPKVHGGILARRDLPEHMATIEQHGIPTIDLVCVNLYPFARDRRQAGCTLDDAIENIDIGGPAMVRSSAKNYAGVAVVTDPETTRLLAEMKANGGAEPTPRASRWPRRPSRTPRATTRRSPTG
jgi:phosphoribosylaminoimidazolecarboxamide formyltransferase/IMP cyclohydrolase